jgi:hypothetical protein
MANDLITPSTANSSAMWEATSSSSSATSWTLSVSPLLAGDLLVFATSYASAGTMTALSGGGCNASGSGLDGAWQRIAGPFASVSWDLELWMGKVITPGASTITATISGQGTGQSVRRNCKAFTTTGGLGTIYTQVGAGGTRANTTASTTVTFPTMTPSGINRLYLGFGTNGTGQTTGATAGYTVELDPGTNPVIYNASVPNSAQTPTSVTSSSASYLVAALIKADNPTARMMPFFAPAHHADELEQRPSGLYVQRRRVFGYRRPSAGVLCRGC